MGNLFDIGGRPAAWPVAALVAVWTGGAFGGVDIQNGVLDTPNAYVMENTQFNIGMSSYALTSGTRDFYTHDGQPFQKSLRELDAFFQVGLLGRVELGVREYDPQTFSGNVKVLIKKESARWPAFAAGVFNLGPPRDASTPYGVNTCWYSDNDRQNNAYYLVASKNMRNILRVPMTVHLGVGSARFQGGDPSWPHSQPWQGLFGSLEYHFLDEKISILGEIDGRDLNIGARFKLPWGFVVTPYVSELEQWWWGGHSTQTIGGTPYEDEYDTPKGGIAVQLFVGPLYSRAETERIRALRSRLKRAEERLKQARQRRELLERRVEEIREDLIGP